MTESTLANTRQKSYSGPQARWITHCSANLIDPFSPTAMEVLNYLAEGIETKHWAVGTVNNYRSAILSLFPDRHNYWSDPDFSDFFRHLSSNAIK